MTVGEMLARMTSRELNEWMAFYEAEPFGMKREDDRAAIVAATVANVHRGKGQRAYRLSDFTPKYQKRATSVQQMKQVMHQIAAMANRKQNGKRR